MTCKQIISFLPLGAILFYGCGSDETIYETEPMPEKVSSIKDVPNCTSAYDGETIYVKEMDKKLVCSDGFWVDSASVSSSSKKTKSSSSSTKGSSGSKDNNSGDKGWDYQDHLNDGGMLTDKRDNEKYKTVIINGKRWMAENLRFTTDSIKQVCFKGKKDLCKTMGNLYSYSVKEMGYLPGHYESDAGIFDESVLPPRDNICPEGWRLPTSEDWNEVLDLAKELITGSGSYRSMSALLDSSWNPTNPDTIEIGGDRLGFKIVGTPVTVEMSKNGDRSYISSMKADSIPFWISLYSPHTKDIDKTMKSSKILIWPDSYSYKHDETSNAFIRCIERDEPLDGYKPKIETMVDERYGDTYKVIKFGSQWWFAEDLRFKDNPDDCNPYAEDEEIRGKCTYSYNQVQNYPGPNQVCPVGWRLPSRQDWRNMFYFVDMHNGSKNVFRSIVSPKDSTGIKPSEFGMDLIPAESYYTTDQGSESIAFSSILFQYLVYFQENSFYYMEPILKDNYKSRVRCIKDEEE